MSIFWDRPSLWLVRLTDGGTIQVTSSEYSEAGDFVDFAQTFRMDVEERRALLLHVPPPDSDPKRVPMIVARMPRSSVLAVSRGEAG
jgi:hypothetical protein